MGRQAHLQTGLTAEGFQLAGVADPAFRVVIGIYLGLRGFCQFKREVFDLDVQLWPEPVPYTHLTLPTICSV